MDIRKHLAKAAKRVLRKEAVRIYLDRYHLMLNSGMTLKQANFELAMQHGFGSRRGDEAFDKWLRRSLPRRKRSTSGLFPSTWDWDWDS
jgi:hypothetical protein